MEPINGTLYDDTLYGTGADDAIYGFTGNDVLKGFGGADRLDGGFGVDTAFYVDSTVGVTVNLDSGRGYYGTAAGDRLFNIENLYGSYHNDVLIGTEGANAFYGLNGNDTLIGGGGADRLDGSVGNDTLKGGGAADQLIGDAGIDTADYSLAPSAIHVRLDHNEGYWGEAEGDTLIGIENVTGSAYADHLDGDDGANVLTGMNGNDILSGQGRDDRLIGGNGDDRLEGGTGIDTMIGGAGDDFYVVDRTEDVVVEYGGQGNDTVYALASYALPSGADIEVFRADGEPVPMTLTGNSSGNYVIGNNADNVIAGGDGNDELRGRGGFDSFLFDTPLNAATNVDIIDDFVVADDTILLDQDIFSSSLGLGNISASELVIGTAAQDANDRIVYDSATGALLYDSDGVGGTAAIQFAQLSTGLAPTYLDFLVV